MALGIILDALDSTSKAFANMKTDLDEEKVARLVASRSRCAFSGSQGPENLRC
jgi:hypothetical protein